ncbi:MAG TPA: glycosyltransferase [Gemmatimonadaceae bacterium]|nr:glycosyltransferase [Gemmatimonadaceae bacterium]
MEQRTGRSVTVDGRLRVALVAGTLGAGGAEKQLVYLAGALKTMGAEVTVCSLTRGEHYEPVLREAGLEPIWVGRFASPAARTLAIARALAPMQPHIVQATHFYTNLYASLVAPVYGALGVGTARSDIVHEVRANGMWGRWLLRIPGALIVNSHAARRNAIASGVDEAAVTVLPNVIDLREFDSLARCESVADSLLPADGANGMVVAAAGSLLPVKRFDRFIRAIALARARGARVSGVIAGDGPLRAELEALPATLGLPPDAVIFTGRLTNLPALLERVHAFVLSSEHEGFPNVLIEAMAARLPTIATPAGDASSIVQDGATGFLVPMDDEDAMAARLLELEASPPLRARLGAAGRSCVERCYASDALPERLAGIYRSIALRRGNRRVLSLLGD